LRRSFLRPTVSLDKTREIKTRAPYIHLSAFGLSLVAGRGRRFQEREFWDAFVEVRQPGSVPQRHRRSDSEQLYACRRLFRCPHDGNPLISQAHPIEIKSAFG
jgi:hypothetical protein